MYCFLPFSLLTDVTVRIAFILRLLAFFALLSSTVASGQESRIAAIVNDEVISVTDVTARVRLGILSSGLEDNEQTRQRMVGQVLRTLVDEALQMQEAKRNGIATSERDIQAAVGRIEAQNKMQKGGLEQFLKSNGIPENTMANQIRASLTWNKLVQNRLLQDAQVSDEEISEALQQYKENAGQPQVRVAEIFLAVDIPSQEDEVLRLAARLSDQIRNGANFAAVAQQFSQSPTAAVGGDVGWMAPTQLGAELGSAIDRMNVGELSPPVRSAGGIYILYLIDKKLPQSSGDTMLSLSQVVFPLAPNASATERAAVIAKAQAVADQAKSCGEMSRMGREQSPDLSGDIGQIKVSDIPAEIRDTVLALQVAEASKPLALRGGMGVLMVCEREEAGDGTPTREQMADIIGRQRLDTLARRYLRDLRRIAFVDIRV